VGGLVGMQLARQACLAVSRGTQLWGSSPCPWVSSAATRWVSQPAEGGGSRAEDDVQGAEDAQAPVHSSSSAQGEEMPEAMRRMVEAFNVRSPAAGRPEQQEAAAGAREQRQRQPFLSAAARRRAESDAAAADAAAAALAAASTPPTDAFQVVLRAVENCKPLMKLSQLKMGSRVAHVPIIISPAQQRSLALRWILEAARKRHKGAKLKTTSLADCLAAELLLAAQCKGAAREKRDALHKLALENRAMLMRV